MRKAKVFRPEAALPRMSWSSANLYNLIARSQTPVLAGQTSFVGSTTTATIYQQRWRAKRMIRGYHGDYIPEKRFKRWFLPTDLPSFQNPAASGSKVPRAGGMFQGGRKSARESGDNLSDPEEKLPIASLFVREVERRLDTAVFRCCFARSIYEARAMVVHGKVRLNGTKFTDPGRLLEPSDLISVDAISVPMLAYGARIKEAKRRDREKIKKRKRARRAEFLKRKAAEEEAKSTEAASEISKEEGTESAPLEGSSLEISKEEGTKSAPRKGSSSESQEATKVEESTSEDSQDEGSAEWKRKRREPLPEGVLRFILPKFAAPHLFIPPYLEVSFTTCSAIYLRHPTLIAPSRSSRTGTTDIPSPYSATGELWPLAWEHYLKNAPRVRGEERRTKREAKVGRSGFETSRKKDQWGKLVAMRRGWLKKIGDREKNVTKGGSGGNVRVIPWGKASGGRMKKRRKLFRMLRAKRSKK